MVVEGKPRGDRVASRVEQVEQNVVLPRASLHRTSLISYAHHLAYENLGIFAPKQALALREALPMPLGLKLDFQVAKSRSVTRCILSPGVKFFALVLQ